MPSLTRFLPEAEFLPGHRPGWIETLYPILHVYLWDELNLLVPYEQITEFHRLREKEKAGEELQQFIDKYIPDSDEAFKNAFRKFRQMCLRAAMVVHTAPK